MNAQLVSEAQKRIAPYVRHTPYFFFDSLSQSTGKSVYVKLESLQKTGSFKIRGAANAILSQMDQAKKAGVIAASAGNHAQGVAAICSTLGISSTICMPTATPALKVLHTQRWGANVVLHGDNYDEAYDHAMSLSEKHGSIFIHAYRDPLVIAGQGTIALEMLNDPAFSDCEAVVVSVGGGGISSGIATVLKELRPKIKIYGVSAMNAPGAWKSYHAKTIVDAPVRFTLAEGVAAKCSRPEMLDFMVKHLDNFFAISEDSIASAVALLAEQGKLVTEGAGALSIAAVMEGLIPEKNIAAIVSGGNIDPSALSQVLRRGLVRQGRLSRLAVTVDDRPGGLASITKVLAEKGANVVEVHHQRGSLHTTFGETKVDFEIETRGPDHLKGIIGSLTQAGFSVETDA